MSFCGKVWEGTAMAYYAAEAYKKGLGYGVAEAVVGTVGAMASSGALLGRSAICYAAGQGLLCSNSSPVPALVASAVLLVSVLAIRNGAQHIAKEGTGDPDAMRKLGNRVGTATTGRDDLGEHAQSALQHATAAAAHAQQLAAVASDGYNAFSSWWYGTNATPTTDTSPAAAAAASATAPATTTATAAPAAAADKKRD